MLGVKLLGYPKKQKIVKETIVQAILMMTMVSVVGVTLFSVVLVLMGVMANPKVQFVWPTDGDGGDDGDGETSR